MTNAHEFIGIIHKFSIPTQIQILIKFYPFLYHLYQFIQYPNSKCLPVLGVPFVQDLLQEKKRKEKKERKEREGAVRILFFFFFSLSCFLSFTKKKRGRIFKKGEKKKEKNVR